MPPKRKNSDVNSPLKEAKLEVFTDPHFLSKKSHYLQMCHDDPKYFVNGPIEMKNDRDCAYATLCVNESAFVDVSTEIAIDVDFLHKVLKENPRIMNMMICSDHYNDLKVLHYLLQKCSKEEILTFIPHVGVNEGFVRICQKGCFQSDIDSRYEIIREIINIYPENIQYLDVNDFLSTADKEFLNQLIIIVVEKLPLSCTFSYGNRWSSFWQPRWEKMIPPHFQEHTEILDAIIKRGTVLNEIESVKWSLADVKQKPSGKSYSLEMNISVEFPKFPKFWRSEDLTDESMLYLARKNGHFLFQFRNQQPGRIFNEETYICALLSCPELFFYPHVPCGTLPIAEDVLNRDTNGNFARLLVSLKNYINLGDNIELMNLARRVESYGTNPTPNTKQFDLLKRGMLHDAYFSFIRY